MDAAHVTQYYAYMPVASPEKTLHGLGHLKIKLHPDRPRTTCLRSVHQHATAPLSITTFIVVDENEISAQARPAAKPDEVFEWELVAVDLADPHASRHDSLHRVHVDDLAHEADVQD